MLIIALLLLAGSPVVPVKPVKPTCRLPLGWNEVSRRHPRYVVFGEQHGTREAPAFVADLICALAARGERVLLAIEHPVVGDDMLRTAWAQPDTHFAERLLHTAWPDGGDGTDSRAMFDMLVRLHRLKVRGAKISITAFNGVRDEAQGRRFARLSGQGPHEAAQAENIRIAAASGRYDRVIVLVGNFHARQATIDDGAGKFDAMARRLAKSGRTISLNMRSSGGTAWNCITQPGIHLPIGQSVPADAIECGDHAYTDALALHRAPFMHVGAFPGETAAPDYDGFFWVERTSGSEPQGRD